jgi:hypothetical protein
MSLHVELGRGREVHQPLHLGEVLDRLDGPLGPEDLIVEEAAQRRAVAAPPERLRPVVGQDLDRPGGVPVAR